MIRGNSTDFRRQVRAFYKAGIEGRIMMLRDFHSPEATWHKGMIYNFESGHPFLLSVIKDWYRDNPDGMIGDIGGLLLAKGEEDEYEIEERKRKSKRDSQRKRCKKELNNIIKKQI
jgi:hypothetical protein